MGFLNPFIYSAKGAATFTDITVGSNPNTEQAYPDYGFNCTKGWDPVTGMGTPIFDQMLAAAMSIN